MNPLAEELNQIITQGNPHIFDMLSEIGRNLYFPKGILSQSAEAKEKAHKLNATIGIATEKGRTMHFDSVMDCIPGFQPEKSLNYAPSFGLPDLRKSWQESLYVKNPTLSGQSISLPIVTSGITHAISVFADVWIDPGDVIIFPDMMWGNYNLILDVRKGAVLKYYPLFSDEGGFNLAGFETCVRAEAAGRSKITVLLNFPNNPTGYTISETEADRIKDILFSVAESGVNVLAVMDDAYFGLFYEDETLKESLFARICGKHPRLLGIKLDGATKETFVWGLRVGFVTYGSVIFGDSRPVYEALEKKTAGAVRGSISNASHLSQSLVLSSLNDSRNPNEKQEKFMILKKRANRVKVVLQNPKYRDAWDVYPFNSGYFMCLRLKTVDAEALRVHLLNTYGVGLVSIGSRNLRVAFSCLEETDVQTLFDLVLQGIRDLT
ncbi:MAG: aminotransferase class I/II-fold pyridoxal phosphate-dependent enzyme [Desulfatirhabdiaceae bacterium]